MIRPILKYGAASLHEPAKPVEAITHDVEQLTRQQLPLPGHRAGREDGGVAGGERRGLVPGAPGLRRAVAHQPSDWHAPDARELRGTQREADRLLRLVMQAAGPDRRYQGLDDSQLVVAAGRLAALESWMTAQKLAAIREILARTR